jgi:hypothetical protein
VGLAVIAPAALMVSLALLAVGGGSFDLASLGQAFSGPSGPTVRPVPLGANPAAGSAGHARSGAGAGTLLAAVASSGSGPSSAGSQASQGRGSGGGGATPGGGSGGGGGAGGGGGGGGTGGGGGGGGGASHHHKSGHRTVVDRVVNTVTPVTSSLPAPVGPILTQVVKSAGAAGDQLLKHLPK